MTTSIAKSNVQGVMPHVRLSLSRQKARKGKRYKWLTIITYTLIIFLAVVYVWGMAIAIRKIYIRLTVTTVVVFEKGGEV